MESKQELDETCNIDKLSDFDKIPALGESNIDALNNTSLIPCIFGVKPKLNIEYVLTSKEQVNREKIKRCEIRASNDFEAVSCWLREYQHKKTTYLSYKKEAERLLLWCIYSKGKALSDLDIDDFKSYFRFLLNPTPEEVWCCKKGYQRVGQNHPHWRPFLGPLSLCSQKTAIAIINSLFNYLKDANYLSSNPIRLIKQYQAKFVDSKVAKFKVWERILEKDEWEEMLVTLKDLPATSAKEIAKKEKTTFLLSMLYLLGLRINEVATHSWSAFRETEGKWWFYVVGKGDKEARIPVTDELLNYVVRYRKYLNLKALPGLDEVEPLLVSYHTKKPLSVRQLYRMIKELGFKTAQNFKSDPKKFEKLKKFSPHWVRHLSASHQDVAGIPLKHIKANHRHVSEMTTYNYIHSEEDERHEQMQKLQLGLKISLDVAGNNISSANNVKNKGNTMNANNTINDCEIADYNLNDDLKNITNHCRKSILSFQVVNNNYDKKTVKEKLIKAIENTVLRNYEFNILTPSDDTNTDNVDYAVNNNANIVSYEILINDDSAKKIQEKLNFIIAEINFEASIRNCEIIFIKNNSSLKLVPKGRK